MDRVRLSKFLENDEISALVMGIAKKLNLDFCVFDSSGKLLIGRESASSSEFSVDLDGEPLGKVCGDADASIIASLLNHLVRQERDIRAISRETLERYQEISIVYDLADKIAVSLDPGDVGKAIIKEIEESFHADSISIMLKDEEKETLKVVASLWKRGVPKGYSKTDRKIVADILASGRAEIVNNVRDDPRYSTGDGFERSMACAPMRVKGRTLGLIIVKSAENHNYAASDLKLLKAIATQSAAPIESARLYDKLNFIQKIIDEANHLHDLESILDKILYESRKLANADAGSIFLLEDDELKFSYVHNDTLFKENETNKAIYSNISIPVNEKSIVGYAAITGKSLVIEDAYSLPDNLPYTFNSAPDEESGYRTKSVFSIPIKTTKAKLVGIMQIINAKNEKGVSVPFTSESQAYIPIFTNNAARAIEQGVLTKQRILQMMQLAELRDPKETAIHVQRVGAYCGEIYQQWAKNKGLAMQEIKQKRDLIRLASMLHDVGKVGIADAILKKPARLTSEEYDTMKWHTIFGARIFNEATSDLDKMCYQIILYHHEKWDGSGYPGDIDNVMTDDAELGKGLVGEEIPIHARVSALADVYDALSSARVYKDAWSDERVYAIIREESGKHFDADLVEAFFQITDLIRAIKQKFRETSQD